MIDTRNKNIFASRALLATVTALLWVPCAAFAQTTPTTFAGLVSFFIGLINIIIPVLFGLLFLFIVWKIIDAWVIHAADEKKRDEGKQLVVVAVIVMVVMVSAWGIVAMIQNSIFG